MATRTGLRLWRQEDLAALPALFLAVLPQASSSVSLLGATLTKHRSLGAPRADRHSPRTGRDEGAGGWSSEPLPGMETAAFPLDPHLAGPPGGSAS